MDINLSLNNIVSASDMEINRTYTYNEIAESGLQPHNIENIDVSVFESTDKVFFFEPVDNENFRLYSIISKKSFFL